MFEKTKSILSNSYEVAAFIVRVGKNGSVCNPIRSLKAEQNECVILANGPSLADSFEEHPTFCEGKTTICMGEFSASDYYARIKPRYYLCIDAVFYAAAADPQFIGVRTRTFGSIVKKTSWPMTIIAPHKAKHESVLDEISTQNKNVRVAYYNNSQIIGPRGFRHFVYSKNLGCPIFQNTLIAGIFFALNMGHRQIYLLGADHSWLEDTVVSDNNVLCIRRGYHFSDQGDHELVPNMRSNKGDVFRMHEFLGALAITFEGYIVLEEYARSIDAKILNASKKSYIDAFERHKIAGA